MAVPAPEGLRTRAGGGGVPAGPAACVSAFRRCVRGSARHARSHAPPGPAARADPLPILRCGPARPAVRGRRGPGSATPADPGIRAQTGPRAGQATGPRERPPWHAAAEDPPPPPPSSHAPNHPLAACLARSLDGIHVRYGGYGGYGGIKPYHGMTVGMDGGHGRWARISLAHATKQSSRVSSGRSVPPPPLPQSRSPPPPQIAEARPAAGGPQGSGGAGGAGPRATAAAESESAADWEGAAGPWAKVRRSFL